MKQLCCILLALLPMCARASDETIASSFYPQSLMDQTSASGAGVRSWATVRVAPFSLVIAYSNGVSGVVRLVHTDGNSASLVSERTGIDGAAPAITALDLTNDQVPEVLASYRTGRRGERTTYIYGWTSTALTPLLTDDNGHDAGVVNASFLDVDGDGTLEIVEPRSSAGDDAVSGQPDNTFDVYKYANGHFTTSPGTLSYAGVFQRATGAPKAREEQFTATAGSYMFRIINGDANGNRVDSAEVRLNGAVIFGPSQFKNGIKVLSAPVTLASTNTISVEVRSAPKSILTVTIAAAAP